jgi:hypothetical protein
MTLSWRLMMHPTVQSYFPTGQNVLRRAINPDLRWVNPLDSRSRSTPFPLGALTFCVGECKLETDGKCA